MRRKILANEQISNGLLLEFSLYGQWRITFDNFLNLLVCQLFGVLGFVIKHSPRMDPGGEGRSSYWVVSTPNAVEGILRILRIFEYIGDIEGILRGY